MNKKYDIRRDALNLLGKGMSIQDIASRLNCSNEHVYNATRGERRKPPDAGLIRSLANAGWSSKSIAEECSHRLRGEVDISEIISIRERMGV